MLACMISFNPTTCLWKHFCSSSRLMLELPRPRELHLWCLFPDEVHLSSQLQLCEDVLSCEERSHMFQIKSKKLQKEFLLTRILARTLLARYTGGRVDPKVLKFERSKFGKPQVVWPTHAENGETLYPRRLCFNLSHTQSLIACAITNGSQVGIDVEEQGRVLSSDPLTFARRKFSEEEAVGLEQISDPGERNRRFLQLWTLKEAYGKALGKGIAGTTLRDIAFHFKATSAACNLVEKTTGVRPHEKAFSITFEVQNSVQCHSDSWQFLLLQPTDVHYLSDLESEMAYTCRL